MKVIDARYRIGDKVKLHLPYDQKIIWEIKEIIYYRWEYIERGKPVFNESVDYRVRDREFRSVKIDEHAIKYLLYEVD